MRISIGQDGNLTPFGMEVEEIDTLHGLVQTLERTSDYRARREEIAAFNASSPIMKRGLALTPVKFGISFTLVHLNQAGALVHVYQDGSVHLNHGGTEMGQGLYIKVAQVVAEEFGIAHGARAHHRDHHRESSQHVADRGLVGLRSQRHGGAHRGAARSSGAWRRMRRSAFGVPEDQIEFRDDRVFVGNESLSFAELAKKCVLARVQLSEAGFYKTPNITWDRATATGRPFFYFAYGAACSEVIVDTLTGENQLRRVDILHDVGRSLNPAIDIGQIEGGFVQGMGWLTTEELVFDTQGRLLTHAPSTYKIPVASDVPEDFRVALYPNANPQDTIYRSKAVGEPPIMLANSVFCAHRRCGPRDRSVAAGAARCAGDAGGDPARLRGLARTADARAGRRVKTWRHLAEFLAAHGAAALIGVHDVKGSAPREAGARMVVRPDGAFHGTIGGGQLEMKMLGDRRARCSPRADPRRACSIRRSGPISANAAAGASRSSSRPSTRATWRR